jgi:hypothetical protein
MLKRCPRHERGRTGFWFFRTPCATASTAMIALVGAAVVAMPGCPVAFSDRSVAGPPHISQKSGFSMMKKFTIVAASIAALLALLAFSGIGQAVPLAGPQVGALAKAAPVQLDTQAPSDGAAERRLIKCHPKAPYSNVECAVDPDGGYVIVTYRSGVLTVSLKARFGTSKCWDRFGACIKVTDAYCTFDSCWVGVEFYIKIGGTVEKYEFDCVWKL